MRFESRGRRGVSSIVGSIFFILIMVVAIASLVSIFNSFTGYNQQVNKASGSSTQAKQTSLSVTGSSFGAFPPSTTSNLNVAGNSNTCNNQATFPTNRPKLDFAAGMWWVFFTCNSNFQFSASFDGVTWQAPANVPSLVAGYTVGPYFDTEIAGTTGTTLYMVIAKVGATNFQLGIGTLTAGGTNAAPAGTIVWTSPPTQVTTVAGSNAIGPINMAIDTAGNQWVIIHVGATALAVYERQACATGTSTANGWEPNACNSSAAPSNNAPASFSGLSANARTIFNAAPNTLSQTGVILMYETGSATDPSTGSLTAVTQASLNTGSSAWNSITLTSIGFDYSITSSSAQFIGNTMYFAGLANAAVGQTTGTLRFWSITFTSMTVATNTADTTGVNGNPIESSTQAWQAALTSSGTTLVLFDAYLTGTTIQYYTSSTLGSIWSSAVTLVSAESAVNGLNPSENGFAIIWTGAAANYNIRFAALSTVTVTNSSPFSVHLVDLYVQNPATNSLAAHLYVNSSEIYDYWIGQGSTAVIPLRFIWAAATSYLFTVSTDTGVTAQLTASSPPVSSTTCSAGQFLSQVTPAQTCTGVPAAASPAVSFASNANTCTDTTSGTAKMMGFGLTYTTSSSSSGNIYAILTFDGKSPAVSNVNSKWQLAYGTGAAPACNAAVTGTTTAQQYTLNTEAAVALERGESVGVTISGLSASTAYWFDVQVLDSTTDSWVYSLPALSVTEILTSGLQTPQVGYSSNTNTCTISSASTLMGGLGTTYTTGGTGFSGNLYLTLTAEVTSPATTTINSQWRIAYGTGTAPACAAASSGTTVGNQYQVGTQAGVVLQLAESESVVITGLTASTTYWFDVQVTDSTAASWIYSNPTLAVVEMPKAQYLPPNVNFASSANSCGRNTAANGMAGLGATYTTLSSSTGSVFAALTFKVASPATANLNSKWQVVYGTGAVPTCNAAASGTTVGRQYTINTEAAVAGAMGETTGFVLTGLSKGTQYWFDVQATDSTTAVWTYSNPAISVMDILPADFTHDNAFFSSNTNTCTRSTAATAMAGFATSYTTTSYGVGNVRVVLTFVMGSPIDGSTSSYTISYGTGAAPACNAAATGTTVGNTIVNVYTSGGQSIGFVLIGLSPGTKYWFDVRALDSTTANWVYSNPEISVIELP